MIQSTFTKRFDAMKNRRENARKFFSEEMIIWMPLVGNKTGQNESELHFYFMKYVSSVLMVSKSLEEFVARCIMDKMEAEEKMGFPEEFDWVNLCVLSAKIHTGKGPDRLTQYSYIHASFELVKHYELKILKLMLDEMDGKNKDYTEFLEKIDSNK